MDTRRRIAVLVAACGVSLGVGVPLLALTALPHTEVADGYVLWVHPRDRAMLLHDVGGATDLRTRNVLVHLPGRAALRVRPGGAPVSSLRPGQRIRVTMGRRSHWAHTITLER